MGKITREDLWRRLKRGEIAPLYLLHGPEDYLRDAAARGIADIALEGAALRDFNDESFSLLSGGAERAVAAAEQLPMMAPRRVVRITDFGRLRDEDENVLAHYIARPAETSVVIFVTDDLDKRRKLSKSLLDICASVEFTTLKDIEMTAWSKDRLKHLKTTADERALRQVIALAGQNVRRLAMELEKLSIAVGPAGHISIEVVDELVGRSREHTNFELSDYLISGNRRRALETLERLLDDGAEPVMLIGLLASNFHRLALAKDLMSRGAPNNEVFRLVPMPQGRRQDFLATARRADHAELSRRIQRIAAADLAIKTSLGTPRLQLEMLVCELSS